jgi:alpha-glucosidase (family GH31 glycosyl hydrolase)
MRRMHWGAFQPVMENVPKGAQPWDPIYGNAVMQSYAYYATLHAELLPYLHSYDQGAFQTQTPILRNTNTAKFSAQLGNEFWVQYVTDYVGSVKITPPTGEWINYWNESQIFQGGKTYQYSAPPGKEPILIRRGAVIPMRVTGPLTGHGTKGSVGALTLQVYPIQHSTFEYYDPANNWVTFDVTTDKQRAALCSLNAAPSQPLLWRLTNVRTKPNSVKTQNGAVGVNTTWGTPLIERNSELRVGNNTSGWYYDALNKRLIVKITNTGTDCPVP